MNNIFIEFKFSNSILNRVFKNKKLFKKKLIKKLMIIINIKIILIFLLKKLNISFEAKEDT